MSYVFDWFVTDEQKALVGVKALSFKFFRFDAGAGLAPRPLSTVEIFELEKLLCSVFSYLDKLKSQNPLAEEIQFPNIPPVLRESLIIQLHQELFEGSESADFGKPDCDIRLTFQDGISRRVQVKATGESAFEFFGRHDLDADYLVWIHFGRYFHGTSDSIAVYVLRKPSRFLGKR
jgi:hypothetical protein